MQIYDFLLEQSCISRCLTLIVSQISNFIADTNHFCYMYNRADVENGNGCEKWERLWERLHKIIFRNLLTMKPFSITFASTKVMTDGRLMSDY